MGKLTPQKATPKVVSNGSVSRPNTPKLGRNFKPFLPTPTVVSQGSVSRPVHRPRPTSG